MTPPTTPAPSIMDQFLSKARESPRRVLFPEGDDDRIVEAAARMAADGTCRPVLLGDAAAIGRAAADVAVEVIDPKDPALIDRQAESYAAARQVKTSIAKRLMKRPLYLAASLLADGAADAMVAGVAHPTEQVLSAAGLAVGFEPGVSSPSSFFIMEMPAPDSRVFLFADCAVQVDPDPAQLADIAVTTARNARRLLGIEPRVAMLCFSTKGSARHGKVDKVREATELARGAAPDLHLDGEMQADAAIVESVGAKKAPGSPVAGHANVLVFPDLNAGNIAYKLVQRLAGAKAIGPVVQGYRRPVNDLSRGASVDDVIGVTAIATLQCGQS